MRRLPVRGHPAERGLQTNQSYKTTGADEQCVAIVHTGHPRPAWQPLFAESLPAVEPGDAKQEDQSADSSSNAQQCGNREYQIRRLQRNRGLILLQNQNKPVAQAKSENVPGQRPNRPSRNPSPRYGVRIFRTEVLEENNEHCRTESDVSQNFAN